MAGREVQVRAHAPKPSAGAPRIPRAPARSGCCPGPAVQLAAVHRVLRHGPVAELRAAGSAPARRLPDEAGNVVQQARQRVEPAQLERTRGADPVRPAGDGVVQRAIGYEAEVGALRVTPIRGQPDPGLAKGMVLWGGSGWDVSVDEIEGNFDLEFRTDPIDDLVAGGRGTAQSRLQTIATLWTRIAAVKDLQPANSLNSSAPANVGIRNVGPQNAQLQASAGLSLDALRAIRTGTAMEAADQSQDTVAALEGGGAADKAIADVLGARQGEIRDALGLGSREDIGNLSAVIGMIVNIPFTARHGGITYAKQAAGPLLARTDFATILAQLPPNQVQAIRDNAGRWRDLLIGISERLININDEQQPVDADTPAFDPDSFEGAEALANLTLGGWFEGLAQGEDRMTAIDYAARHGDQDAAARLESLGSYGKRMDAGSYILNQAALLELTGGLAVTVAGIAAGVTTGFGAVATTVGALGAVHGGRNIGTANLNRPIFEFRALGLADEENLVQSGLALWDYVDVAHDRGPGGANRLSASARLWNWLAS